MKKMYNIKSDFCGTLASCKKYTEKKAKELATKWTKEAAELGFPEVTYSATKAIKKFTIKKRPLHEIQR